MKSSMTIRLSKEILQRLEALAQLTGQTKTYFAREAIILHLEDLEDTYIAGERLKNPGRRWTMEEIEEETDL